MSICTKSETKTLTKCTFSILITTLVIYLHTNLYNMYAICLTIQQNIIDPLGVQLSFSTFFIEHHFRSPQLTIHLHLSCPQKLTITNKCYRLSCPLVPLETKFLCLSSLHRVTRTLHRSPCSQSFHISHFTTMCSLKSKPI